MANENENANDREVFSMIASVPRIAVATLATTVNNYGCGRRAQHISIHTIYNMYICNKYMHKVQREN